MFWFYRHFLSVLKLHPWSMLSSMPSSTLLRWNSLMGILRASEKVRCLRRTVVPKVRASMSSVPTAYTLPAFASSAH